MIIKGVAALNRFADKLAQALVAAQAAGALNKEPLLIYLKGDLGVGKTTLVRALLRVLGVTDRIKSPTFTLIEPYVSGDLHIYHFDLYRLNSGKELENLSARDYFVAGNICLIEWSEKAGDFLPAAALTISLAYVAGHATWRKLDCTASFNFGNI